MAEQGGVTAQGLEDRLGRLQMETASMVQDQAKVLSSTFAELLQKAMADLEAKVGQAWVQTDAKAEQTARAAAAEAAAGGEALSRDQILLDRVQALEAAMGGGGIDLDCEDEDSEDEGEISISHDGVVYHSDLWPALLAGNPVHFAVFRQKVESVIKRTVSGAQWFEVDTHLKMLESILMAPTFAAQYQHSPGAVQKLLRIYSDRWLFLVTAAKTNTSNAIKTEEQLSGHLYPRRYRTALARTAFSNATAHQAKALKLPVGGGPTTAASPAPGGRKGKKNF